MKTSIVTPVLKYWGFDRHPFSDFILRNDGLNLFVDREIELHRLENCLCDRLTGIFGRPGIGKSSFLRKFQEILRATYPVIYLQMAGNSEKVLYREILAGVLKNIRKGIIKTTSKLDIEKEISRLENSLQQTKGSEIGASAVFNGQLSEANTTNQPQHTEDSAFNLLRGIIQKTNNPFVIIIDDMERIKFMFETEEKYFRYVTAFARNVNESFNNPIVSFIITLDDQFARKVGSFDNPTVDDDNSFSFSAMIEMKTFKPEILVDIIKTRLRMNKWKGGLESFIAKEAFWTLQYITGGHARKALSAIRAAMEYIEFNKQKCQITSASLISGFREFRDKVPETKHLPLINYLLRNGRSSPSDDKFLKEIGISRPSMLNYLKELVDRNCVQTTKPAGATEKQQYSMVELKNW